MYTLLLCDKWKLDCYRLAFDERSKFSFTTVYECALGQFSMVPMISFLLFVLLSVPWLLHFFLSSNSASAVRLEDGHSPIYSVVLWLEHSPGKWATWVCIPISLGGSIALVFYACVSSLIIRLLCKMWTAAPSSPSSESGCGWCILYRTHGTLQRCLIDWAPLEQFSCLPISNLDSSGF